MAAEAIARINPELNAVVHDLTDMGRAAAADVRPDAPFAGVPYLLKESGTEWEGAPNTSASTGCATRRAADAEVVRRIKAAGFPPDGQIERPGEWLVDRAPSRSSTAPPAIPGAPM